MIYKYLHLTNLLETDYVSNSFDTELSTLYLGEQIYIYCGLLVFVFKTKSHSIMIETITNFIVTTIPEFAIFVRESRWDTVLSLSPIIV